MKCKLMRSIKIVTLTQDALHQILICMCLNQAHQRATVSMHVGVLGYIGNLCTFHSFCCEPKTVLKNEAY